MSGTLPSGSKGLKDAIWLSLNQQLSRRNFLWFERMAPASTVEHGSRSFQSSMSRSNSSNATKTFRWAESLQHPNLSWHEAHRGVQRQSAFGAVFGGPRFSRHGGAAGLTLH